MAEHQDSHAVNGMDYKEHQATYDLFIFLVKLVSGLVAVILVGMALFLLPK